MIADLTIVIIITKIDFGATLTTAIFLFRLKTVINAQNIPCDKAGFIG